MGYITARTSVCFELMNADQYTFLGRTITFFEAAMKLTAADRYNQQTWQISAGISAQALTLQPLGVSAPVGMAFFLANQPVDMRFGDPATSNFLSAVMMMTFGGQVSGLYVTTGSSVTQIWLMTAGGSAAVLTASTPNP